MLAETSLDGSDDLGRDDRDEQMPETVDVDAIGVDATVREVTVEELKRELFLTVIGSNRGFAASPDRRTQVLDIIAQLERKNTLEEPVNEISMLAGTWSLLYTNALDVLSLGLLAPVASLGQIFQNIESTDNADVFDVTNVVELEPAFAPVSNSFIGQTKAVLSVKARGEKKSPMRIDITFERASIRPEKVVGFPVPQNFFPALTVPLRSPVGYIDTTFLDSEIRIARAPPTPRQGENVFVLKREE